MKRRCLSEVAGALLAVIGFCVPAAADPDAARLYSDNCASCHGADRLGTSAGPAILAGGSQRPKGR